jgi:hypothetical protein
MGIPGLSESGQIGEAYSDIASVTDPFVSVAKGELDVPGLQRAHKK